jgi:hypothetical protein
MSAVASRPEVCESARKSQFGLLGAQLSHITSAVSSIQTGADRA